MEHMLSKEHPEITVDVSVLFQQWTLLINDYQGFCSRLVYQTIKACKRSYYIDANHKMEVSIVLADDAFIQELNLKFRNINKATNVLSFPCFEFFSSNQFAQQGVTVLGDVVISYSTVFREAQAIQGSFIDYSAQMVVHGILHLMGFDHVDDDDAVEMAELEAKVLLSAGVSKSFVEAEVL